MNRPLSRFKNGWWNRVSISSFYRGSLTGAQILNGLSGSRYPRRPSGRSSFLPIIIDLPTFDLGFREQHLRAEHVCVVVLLFQLIHHGLRHARFQQARERWTRLGTHSNPGDHYGCEGETREIVLRMAVISGCDAPPVLELAEHSFDEISAFVGPAVQGIGRPA